MTMSCTRAHFFVLRLAIEASEKGVILKDSCWFIRAGRLLIRTSTDSSENMSCFGRDLVHVSLASERILTSQFFTEGRMWLFALAVA